MLLYAPLSSDIDRSLNVISTRLASVTVGRVSKSTYEHPINFDIWSWNGRMSCDVLSANNNYENCCLTLYQILLTVLVINVVETTSLTNLCIIIDVLAPWVIIPAFFTPSPLTNTQIPCTSVICSHATSWAVVKPCSSI